MFFRFLNQPGGDCIQSITEPVKTSCLFRKPNEEDGADVWTLVKKTGVLDLNSSYSYLMWCKFFRDTTIIAEQRGKVVGFISGFLNPSSPHVLFIWQVAVDKSQRGKGLATKMISRLLERSSCDDVRYIEATVSPSNLPSQKLFKGFAEKMETACKIRNGFIEDHFPENGHEDEPIYRIGPFDK
ncbi:MAG TPA: diaminobutyrate acetyltransferase [Bacillales bacterium]|nr:diaminobutyrate acetyltransferase [Bacillales bacterium]